MDDTPLSGESPVARDSSAAHTRTAGFGLESAATRRTARRLGLAGIGLFLLSWFLGGLAAALDAPSIVPYADMALGLGFALPLAGAVVGGSALWQIGVIGGISGIGHFYKGQDHAVHLLSGWGFSLEHTPHIILGLVLIGVATGLAAFLAFQRTRLGGTPKGL
jgi:hypothetical protein